MQITRQADYAVRAVAHLAKLGPGAKLSTGSLAHAQHIPPAFLAKIVAQLSSVGVLRALRGSRGGVLLAKSADHISLLEVVEAIDGPITLNECVRNPDICPLSDTCSVREVWCDAQAALVDRLVHTTFAQLARPKPLQSVKSEQGDNNQTTETRRGNTEPANLPALV